MPAKSFRESLPKEVSLDECDANEVSEQSIKKALSEMSAEPTQNLTSELMELKYKIKQCDDLKKCGVKNTSQMKERLTNIYNRKLKLYCEQMNYEFDKSLSECEVQLRIQELNQEIRDVYKGGTAVKSWLNWLF